MLPMLPVFLEFIVGSFNAAPSQGCWFELLGKLCEHVSDTSTAMLVRAAESMTAGMVAELKGDLLSLPELLKEYLNFGCELIHVALSEVVYSNVMPTMLEMAMGAVGCDIADLVSHAAGFLQGVLQQGACVGISCGELAHCGRAVLQSQPIV